MKQKLWASFGLAIFLLAPSYVYAKDALDAFLDFLEDPVLGLGTLLMKILTALLIVISSILFVGQYLLTQVMVEIALLVMPIMVPFIMLEKTSFIFEGWIKFLITAGFVKIAGATLFGILLGSVEQSINFANNAIQQVSGSAIAFYVYSTLLLITVLMAYIMLQTQQIGNALVSGFVQGGFKFNPVAHTANTISAAGNATKQLGRTGNTIVGSLYGAYKERKGLVSRTKGAITGAGKGATGYIKDWAAKTNAKNNK